jgi:hypothetical protein
VKSRSRAITFGTGNFHGFWTFWSSFHLDCLNIQGFVDIWSGHIPVWFTGLWLLSFLTMHLLFRGFDLIDLGLTEVVAKAIQQFNYLREIHSTDICSVHGCLSFQSSCCETPKIVVSCP